MCSSKLLIVNILTILFLSLTSHSQECYHPLSSPSPYNTSYLMFDGYNDFIRMDHYEELCLNINNDNNAAVDISFSMQLKDNKNQNGASIGQVVMGQFYLSGWYLYYDAISGHLKFIITNSDGSVQESLDFCSVPDFNNFYSYRFIYNGKTGDFKSYRNEALINSYSDKFWKYDSRPLAAFAVGARNISTGYGEANLNAFNFFHGNIDDIIVKVNGITKMDIDFGWGAGQYAMDENSFFMWDRSQPGGGHPEVAGFYLGATWGLDSHDPKWGPEDRMRAGLTRYSTLGKGFTHWSSLPESAETWLANSVTFRGNLYATGFFNRVNGDTVDNGIVASGIAMWNATTGAWENVGSGLDAAGGYGLHAGVWNDKLVITGRFEKLGDGRTANHIAVWDGNSWSVLGSGLKSSSTDAYGFTTTVFEGNLIAGGTFNTAGGSHANLVAKWDGNRWTNMGAGFDNSVVHSVSSLAVYKNELYAAGDFVTTGASTVLMGLAKWNGTEWVCIETHAAPSYSVGRSFQSLCVFDDKLWVSGRFTSVDGVVCNNIAYFDGNTGFWNAIAPPGTPELGLSGASVLGGGEATDMVADGTTLYIAGSFTKVNGEICNKVASYSPADNRWCSLGNGVDLRPEGLSIFNDHIVITGDLYSADGIEVHNIAMYNLRGYEISGNGNGNNESNVPLSFKFYQNYPNPFNPSTQIKFDIPANNNVTLKIYDILGKEVSVLVNEFMTSGTKTISWNASNNSSGVYFYEIKAGDFRDVKKMILVK